MGRVLLVEDNAALAENLAEILSERGCEIAMAGTGERALEVLGAGVFDAIVTDLRLPGISGLDLLRAARRAGCAAPAVVITAFADGPTSAMAEELGALGVLAKPVNLERLFELVDGVLQRSRAGAPWPRPPH